MLINVEPPVLLQYHDDAKANSLTPFDKALWYYQITTTTYL